MPFLRPVQEEACVAVGVDGTLSPVRASQTIVFARGAFLHAIQQGQVEVVVNHVWKEHLASQRHGLTLRETHAGLYFDLRLPETPFARSIFDAVLQGKLRYVCALSSWTESHADGDRLVITRANLVAVNLLINVMAHQVNTWIMPAGHSAEHRIKSESARAEAAAMWGLDASLSLEAMRAQLQKHPHGEAATILDQLD